LASLELAGKQKISDHTFLFFGAGEAGVGIADLIAMSIVKVISS
jgi:malic enzyme